MGTMVAVIIIVLVIILMTAIVVRTVRIVPQAQAWVIERFGRYHRTLNAGLNVVLPFIDFRRSVIDLREQLVNYLPQPVITKDNLTVNIDTVIYFQVTDPRAATYEIASYEAGVEQLVITTLRNVVGGMDLERTLTSRDEINAELRRELDEATGKWGLRVSHVELKAIEPPPSLLEAMQKQMRADREKRAQILASEGAKQAAILTAEGEKQAAVLRAEGAARAVLVRADAEAQAQATRAEGEAQAIAKISRAIHEGNPDQPLLAFRYLQTLPQIAKGDANKVWIIPSEISKALEGIGDFLGRPDHRQAASQPQAASRQPAGVNGAGPGPSQNR